MKAEQPVERGRVLARYSAEGREQFIREQAQSGMTKAAFCAKHGINIGTFHGWSKKLALVKRPTFAQVDIPVCASAAVEVLLPNGVRIGIRQDGGRDQLVALIRGVAGC